MGECRKVRSYSGGSPCLSEGVTTLGNQCWGKITEDMGSKLLVPPLELIPLVIASIRAFVRQYFLHVAVESLSKGVACRLCTGEVSSFKDMGLCYLGPFFRLRELRKSRNLGWGPFSPHPYTIDKFPIWTWALINCCHGGVSCVRRDTAEGTSGPGVDQGGFPLGVGELIPSVKPLIFLAAAGYCREYACVYTGD
jgi:hypothetical protein